MQADHEYMDYINVSEIVVKECKATYPEIWSSCDWGALIRIMCHREWFPNKISEKNRLFFYINNIDKSRKKEQYVWILHSHKKKPHFQTF